MCTIVLEERAVLMLQVCSEPSLKSSRFYMYGGEETTGNLWKWPIRIRNGGKRTEPQKRMGNVRETSQGGAPATTTET